MSNQPEHFHFLGICGTAMGSVAAALQARGFTVTGSDENVYPPMSTFLKEAGVTVTIGYHADNLPASADIVVVGNAIKRGNPEVEAMLNSKRRHLSLPEVLKSHFLHGRHNMVVTGTHGKTSTSALLAHILERAGKDPGYMIGGLAADLGRGAKLNDSPYFVIEGDEYDTAFFDKRSKFLHYLPELLIINNIEFDHADIFQSVDDILRSFRHLLRIIPSEGVVLANADDPNCRVLAEDCPGEWIEVGLSENAARRISHVTHSPAGSAFQLNGRPFRIPQTGGFHVRNAAMAITAAEFHQIPDETIDRALASFQGVRRRQQIRGEAGGVRVLDDFGHHPSAIRETVGATRHRFPDSRIWAVFEPRSNTTRRNVFQQPLADALAQADGVLLARVARPTEIPEGERLDANLLLSDLDAAGVPAFFEDDADAIVRRYLSQARPGDTVIVFSNGGFDNIHEKLLDALGGNPS